MSFMPTVATLASSVTEQLPMSPYAFGAIAMATFLLLLGVLWSFRNTAAKYDTPVRVGQGNSGDSADSADPHGSAGPGAHH